MTFPAPTDGLRLDALAELASALEPFAKVASLFKDRKPQHGDIIHAWEFTSGSAELRVSDCKRAADALALIDMARRAGPSEQTEPVAWLVRWRPEPNGPEWINAHASKPTAVDEARRHRGTVTPLYALEPLQKLQQLPALSAKATP